MPSLFETEIPGEILRCPQVRWSAERFADEDDPEAAVQHMEMAWNPTSNVDHWRCQVRKVLSMCENDENGMVII